MANFEPIRLLRNLTGRIAGKSQVITRRKHFGLLAGKLIKEGPHEAYLKERRDYKRKPMTEGERRQRERWTEVCREASAIVHDPNHPRHAELYERWQRILQGEADAVLGKRKFVQFGNFVRAVLLRE